jgi:hypothetical protein
MKKITIKKSQSGSSITKAIKIGRPQPRTISDSVRAEEMARYRQLRTLAKRGSTSAKEPAPIDKSTKRQYDAARNSGRSIASEKNGGKIIKKKNS